MCVSQKITHFINFSEEYVALTSSPIFLDALSSGTYHVKLVEKHKFLFKFLCVRLLRESSIA